MTYIYIKPLGDFKLLNHYVIFDKSIFEGYSYFCKYYSVELLNSKIQCLSDYKRTVSALINQRKKANKIEIKENAVDKEKFSSLFEEEIPPEFDQGAIDLENQRKLDLELTNRDDDY